MTSTVGQLFANVSRRRRLSDELAKAHKRMQSARYRLAHADALNAIELAAARDGVVRTAFHISHIKRELEDLK